MLTSLSLKRIPSFVGFLFLCFSVNAQIDQAYFDRLKSERVPSKNDIIWKQVAPGNAGFSDLIRYHPTEPDVALFVPDLWVVYRTTNNGKSWHNVKDKDNNGEFERLRDMYFSPFDKNFGIAIESSQLWTTNDMGASWQLIPNCGWYNLDADGSDAQGWRSKVSAVALDPTNNTHWYVGEGLNPRGQVRWSQMQQANMANPRGPKVNMFAGKIWYTKDAGKTWTSSTSGIDPSAEFARIIVNPKNNEQVFAASNYGIYRSDDGGANWTNIGEGKLPNNIVRDMDYYYNPTTGDFKIYLVDQIHYTASGRKLNHNGGLYVSTDNGDTFKNINGNIGIDVSKMSFGVQDSFFRFIAKWMSISLQEARAKFDLPTNAPQFFNQIYVDPSKDNAVYAAFQDPQIQLSFLPGRMWKTLDGGSTWKSVARQHEVAWEKDKEYWEGRNNEWKDNMEFGHQDGLLTFGDNFPLRATRAASVNSRGDVLLIAGHNTMLSTDGGDSWAQVDEDYTANGNIMTRGNSNVPGEAILQDKRFDKDKIFLASGEHHLWTTTTDGTEGRQALKQSPTSLQTVSALAVHPWDKDIVLHTSFRQFKKEKIMRSLDGGDTFQEWGIATPAVWQMRTHALTINPLNPDIVVFGITDKDREDANKPGGFYFSKDGGKSFEPRNTGLPTNVRVKDILLDPRDKERKSYFAAAIAQWFGINPNVNGGLYHTKDEGLTWTKINTPNVVKGVNKLELDNTGRLYIAVGHRDNPSNNGGVWYTDDFGENWTRVFDNARTEYIDVSPFDNNLLIAVIGHIQKNPGIYLSKDRGLTWSKNNVDGVNAYIRATEFDIHDPTKIWNVSMGNGFDLGTFAAGADSEVVRIKEAPAILKIGESIDLKTQIKEGFQSAKIEFKSDNSEIAVIDTNGKITGVSKGAVKIEVVVEGRYGDFLQLFVADKEGQGQVIANLDKEGVEQSKQFSIYPNPFSNELNIELNELIKEVKVFDLKGGLIYRGSSKIINTSNWLQGVYFVKIEGVNAVYQSKIVK